MKYITLVLVIFGVGLAQANYYCVGKVRHLGLSNDNLNIHNGYGVHRMCQHSQEHCGAWISLAMSAKLADKKIAIYYRNSSISGNQSSGECANIGNWVQPSDKPYYIEVL